jgi:hypothetical protein
VWYILVKHHEALEQRRIANVPLPPANINSRVEYCRKAVEVQ